MITPETCEMSSDKYLKIDTAVKETLFEMKEYQVSLSLILKNFIYI